MPPPTMTMSAVSTLPLRPLHVIFEEFAGTYLHCQGLQTYLARGFTTGGSDCA